MEYNWRKSGGGIPVVAVGNREIRRKLAISFGADQVFDPNEENVAQKIIKASKCTGNAADVVIETSGSTDALNLAAKYVSKYGRIALVGCNRVTVDPVDLYQFHVKGVSIIGSNANTQRKYESCAGIWTGRKHFTAILKYMSDGVLTPKIMNPSIVSPKDATAVYDALLNDREFPLGVIFDWSVI